MNVKKLFQTVTIVLLVMFSVLYSQQPVYGQTPFSVVTGPLSLIGGEGTRAIPIGSTIIHFSNGVTEVRDQQDKVILMARDIEASIIRMPKETVSATYVYEVPSESHITQEKDGRMVVFKDGVRILTVMDHQLMDEQLFTSDHADGVLTYASFFDFRTVIGKVITLLLSPLELEIPEGDVNFYLNDYFGAHIELAFDNDVDNIGYFRAQWEVPSSPTSPNSDTLIYLWNGVEPDDQTDIIQPVIRYMQSDGWNGIAVYGIGSNFYYSSPISLSVGHEVWGTVWWDAGNQNWRITVYDWDTYQSTYITTDAFSASQDAWTIVDLEGADGVSSGSQLPGDTHFVGMEVENTSGQDIDVDWVPHVVSGWAANIQGLSVNVISDTSVDLNTPN